MATTPPRMAIMDFVQRFQSLQQQRDSSDELIKDLLIYCEHVESSLRHENARLVKELEDAQLDLDDARKSRRDLQMHLNLANARAGQSNADCEWLRNRNPYITVLIDGDGMIFNENLVRQGREGGKQAANSLRDTVLDSCEVTGEVEVIAKVCANVTGLSKAMLRDGSLDSVDDLREFTLGFTQGRASFDFVDVGHGKERADSKIKECLRWHLRNHNCKQLLLGISHDAGYAPFLDEVVTPNDQSRITIIEGYPTVRELAATGLRVLPLSNIFRSEKLAPRLASSPSTWAGVTSTAAPPKSASPVIIKNGGVSTITKSLTTPSVSNPSWVPSPRGLDPPITVNPTALDKIKRRTANNKLCNNHYLRGPCAKGDECCFEHDYKATEDDLKAIAYLTRLNPCLNSQHCELEYCIYGHHCPSVAWITGANSKEKEPVCQAFGCRFSKEDHPPGTVIKHPRKERWEKEYERY